MSYLDLSILLIALLGSFSTYWGVYKLKWNSVLSSALFSLIFACIMKVFPWFDAEFSFKLSVVFIGASFIGMSSEKLIENKRFLFIATIFFVIVFLSVSVVFKGFGGGLGTSAAISVISSYGLKKILDRVY